MHFLKMPGGGLKIVLKSPWDGLTDCFLHCINEKKSLRGTPEKSEKSPWGGLKSRHQTPPNTFSNGMALISKDEIFIRDGHNIMVKYPCSTL